MSPWRLADDSPHSFTKEDLISVLFSAVGVVDVHTADVPPVPLSSNEVRIAPNILGSVVPTCTSWLAATPLPNLRRSLGTKSAPSFPRLALTLKGSARVTMLSSIR